SSEVPVGLYRTYARLGDEPFSFEGWCRAVREGRTFLSGGPIIRLRVDGADVGDIVHLSGPGTVTVEATAASVLPMAALPVVRTGEVVAAVDEPTSARQLKIRAEVAVDGDSWIAARCGGPTYWDGPSHRGPWERRIFAHTSPVYVACSEDPWSRSDPVNDRRMLTIIEAGLEHIRPRPPSPPNPLPPH